MAFFASNSRVDRPLVSILINNYNYAAYLEAAVESALGQTYPKMEVIVVDDGSTDGSRAILEKFGKRITPVFKENGGQASAFNRGMEEARGEILLFLDSDDASSPERAEALVGAYGRLPEKEASALLFHLLEVTDKDGRPTGETLPKRPITLAFCERGYVYSRITENLKKISDPARARSFVGQYRYLPFLTTPTSGLSITRPLAEKIFPLPVGPGTEADNFADPSIILGSALLGHLYLLNRPLGTYRRHGKNQSVRFARKKRPKAFYAVRDDFLNRLARREGWEASFSFFDSIRAVDYHLPHREYLPLLRLAFRTPLRHLLPGAFRALSKGGDRRRGGI